jgi:RNA ligase (TIGR02306 family)
VGDNVAERYPWVSKYEPPTREAQTGQGKFIGNPEPRPRNPNFPEYTGINNLRHYPDLFGPDELVVVTEKLHGTNSRIGMVDGEWVAGSHRVQRGEGDEVYWSPRKHAEKLVEALGKYHRQVVLYGEIVGSDVQSLDYGYKGHEGYYAFDLMVDGRYVDHDAFEYHCDIYDVPVVPTLHRGFFKIDDVRILSKGNTLLGVDHIREGVVVKPLIERHDPKVGRCVMKFVSDDYLLAKRSDFTEV